MVHTTQLENGLTILTEEVPYVQSVSLGVWRHVGSRQEDDTNNGVSHFIEHMLFKGTKNRSALQIAQELDFVGGQLNAFTDKEYTCYFARVLSEHLPVAADVLSDMCLNSLFDPEELARERNVVLEEIKMYEDSPDELVHDFFLQSLFQGHPLGRPVIGTPATVGALDRDAVIRYIERWYEPDRTYVVSAGNVKHEEVIRLFAGGLGQGGGRAETFCPTRPEAVIAENRYQRQTEQAHFCLGTRGPSQGEDDRYPLAVLDAAVGGGMSSRLFQEIREKRGLAYSIGSYMHPYEEAGAWVMYAGTSPDQLDEVLELCRTEAGKVRAEGIHVEEFQRAKNQIKGSLLLSLESMGSRMTQIAKSQIYYDRVIPVEEVVARVEAVTLDDVARVADQVLNEDSWTLTVIGPEGD
ncbi:MAG TPA: pitrilysin family protein [Armatimonadota bacterium]|jgi:predicted Zn-dependent peptidase